MKKRNKKISKTKKPEKKHYVFLFVAICIGLAIGFLNSNMTGKAISADDPPEFILEWGSKGSEDGQFYYPSEIDVDSLGNVYIADTFNHRIQVFDENGVFLRKWGSKGSSDGQFNEIEAIAIHPTLEEIYVADIKNNRIQVFDLNGNFLRSWGGLYWPSEIAIDPLGNVYVIDQNKKIKVFDSNGNLLREWFLEYHRYNTPGALAVGDNGNIYYGSRAYHTDISYIVKYDSNGNILSQFGYPMRTDSLTIDKSGNVYIKDNEYPHVKVFDSEDNFIVAFNGGFSLSNVRGLGISPESVYVTDRGNHRILKFKIETIDPCDMDEDGFDECTGEDRCFEVNIPEPPAEFVELKEGRYGLDDAVGLGCTGEEMLHCKPGNNNGEYKYGLTAGTIEVWLSQKGWAKDCPKSNKKNNVTGSSIRDYLISRY